MPGELVCRSQISPPSKSILAASKIHLYLLTPTPSLCLIRKHLQTKCLCRTLSYEKTHEKWLCPHKKSPVSWKTPNRETGVNK